MDETKPETNKESVEPEGKIFDLFTGESIAYINSYEYEDGFTERYVVPSQVVFVDLVYLKKENNWRWCFYVTNINQPLNSIELSSRNEALKFIAPIFSISNGSIGNA